MTCLIIVGLVLPHGHLLLILYFCSQLMINVHRGTLWYLESSHYSLELIYNDLYS